MNKASNYNKLISEHKSEIEKIFNKAKKEGFIIEGDKIIAKKKEVIVIETFFSVETEYESYGDFYIQRQIELLNDNLLNGNFLNRLEEIKSSIDKKDLLVNLWNDVIDEDTLLFGGKIQDYKYDFLDKNDIESIYFSDEERDKSILEVSFKSNTANLHGYMSIFKISTNKLNKLKDLSFSLNFSKVITNDGGNEPYLNFKS